MIIQIVIIGFILYVLWKTYGRFQKRDISGRELGIWTIFWLVVAAAAIIPKETDVVAQLLGVSRGADLLVYISIIVLFFIVFKVIVRLEKIDRDITTIVRRAALKDKVPDNEHHE